jgi:hypothetical protein
LLRWKRKTAVRFGGADSFCRQTTLYHDFSGSCHRAFKPICLLRAGIRRLAAMRPFHAPYKNELLTDLNQLPRYIYSRPNYVFFIACRCSIIDEDVPCGSAHAMGMSGVKSMKATGRNFKWPF